MMRPERSSTPGGRRLHVLLAEIDRAEALGLDPMASVVWAVAPISARRDYRDGHIDSADFWSRTRRWIDVHRGEETWI
jgi:hypothetical protein